MQLTSSNRFTISLAYNLQLILAQSTDLLLAFFRFLFVIELPWVQRHRTLIRGLFLTYLIPAFFVLGPHAIALLAIYQIGFNMLLKAASYT
ncbi:MAG: hypothetical protein AAGN35_16010 [Bacteroidota bacterium]